MTDERHPSPRLQAVFLPEPALPACGHMALYAPDGDPPSLAEVAATGLPPPVDTRVARVVLPGPEGPQVGAVPAAVVPLDAALPALLRPLVAGAPDTLRLWAAAARVARRLAADGRFLPTLTPADGRVTAGWAADPTDPVVTEAVARLAAAAPGAATALAAHDGRVWRADALVRAFLDGVADLAVRAGGPPPRPGRPRARILPWTARWAEALADPSDPAVPLRDDADELVAGIRGWLRGSTVEDPAGSTLLHLHAPDRDDGPWCLEFGVRADDGTDVPAAQVWDTEDEAGDGAPTALQQTLLRDLGLAARVFPPLEPALRTAAPEGVGLDLGEAWGFLTVAADRLADAGVVVVVPPGLGAGELSARLRVGGGVEAGANEAVGETAAAESAGAVPGGRGAGGDRAPEGDPDALAPTWLPGVRRGETRGGGILAGLLTGFRWEVALGDAVLDPEEFRAIVDAAAPLVRIRDRWVRVDPERARRLADLPDPGELSLADALALGLAGSERAGEELLPGLADTGEVVDVVLEGGVEALVERLREVGERPPVPATPDGFAGELRPYQSRGVAWLAGMSDLGFGAVLADDMGLGKTIEFAAFLLMLPPEAGPHLVVCPTSVVGNWERELARFAPRLRVTRHHGAERQADLEEVQGVVLTTYGTLRRDVDALARVRWDVVALDEAQQVKNPATAGARAVRRLQARQRVALTGTPLENRLDELWALLDATNPGLLGSRARFTRRFVAPVEQHGDADAARRLRRLVAPFVLRREKRDPAVIADLPEKVERSVVCALGTEQAALYQAAVDRVLGGGRSAGGSLADANAIERRGRILALLTELKQICNHPAQYLHEEDPELLGRSGKLATARELLAEVAAGGAQMLCFTQYVEMGRLLVRQFGEDLGRPVPFLHGGVPARRRDAIVASFQGEDSDGGAPPPVLVVSLRAGGTGLNLTAATHVLHYDRWWNPAVEDQATDRAHRIGQTETVYVHKLVTAGTVEERVAELLDRKRQLADQIVGSGEAWLTELGEAELAELVALSADPATELDEEDLWAAG